MDIIHARHAHTDDGSRVILVEGEIWTVKEVRR